MTTREDYIKQIDEQSKKPIEQQLDDLKGAGADCLVALDTVSYTHLTLPTIYSV